MPAFFSSQAIKLAKASVAADGVVFTVCAADQPPTQLT